VGDPAGEIVKLIEREKVDAVVMATRGETEHVHDDCVTEWVARNSPVPVKKIRMAA
jgi:nucleotide-binding universal stress UspA family protein